MKALYGALFFLLSIQSVLGQQCDVVVTSPDILKNDLKKDLKAMLNNFEENLDSNCSQTCNETALRVFITEKMDEVMNNITRIISEEVGSLRAQLRPLQLPVQTPSQPATSCAEILQNMPGSFSGYYWIEANEGPPRRRYCDMNWSCGGKVVGGAWMKVAELNMRNSSHSCPSGLRPRSDSNIRTCGINSNSAACSSVIFPVNTSGYSKVCGKIKAYNSGATESFGNRLYPAIDTYYVDGISLTLGNPRRHLWTFAAALDEFGSFPSYNCPCTKTSDASRASQPPAFVGNDYFCDTAATQYQFIFHADNPLWDGSGCGPNSTCCSFNNPPWFYKQLPQLTTDDIEMRVCCDQPRSNEDIAVEMIDIYVQ